MAVLMSNNNNRIPPGRAGQNNNSPAGRAGQSVQGRGRAMPQPQLQRPLVQHTIAGFSRKGTNQRGLGGGGASPVIVDLTQTNPHLTGTKKKRVDST
jgi:hypothetical protein